MGCWNETCFLTRLPIHHGDPVSMILVVENGDGYRNTCHANGYYRPICLPLHGEYDDYGGIEEILFDQGAADVLAAGRFSECHDGTFTDLAVHSDRCGSWDDDIKNLMCLARRDELYITVGDMLTRKPVRRPVLVQMAHRWAWDFITNCSIISDKEYLDSTSFTIGLDGPLKDACRHLANVDHPGPTITNADRIKTASLIAGMESMRMAFGPTSGSGSQDGLWDDHQLEFYRLMLSHAFMSRNRYREQPQAPFTASIAWDGNYVTTEQNNGLESGVDIPVKIEPDELSMAILDAGIRNILNAMSTAESDTEGTQT